MSHISHCNRSCANFDNRLKDKRWREEHPEYIGFCKKYNMLVKDTLCGCEAKSDGSVILWNFSTLEELIEKIVQKNKKGAAVKEQILAIRDAALTNMFDTREVQRLADEHGFHELVCFIAEHEKDYINFIFKLEVLK